MAAFPWKALAVSGGVLVGALGLRALFSGSSSSSNPAAARRVALIGDSYAVGLGPALAKIFPSFKYEGHVGTNTGQWAAHSSACGTCGDWITSFQPTDVLVSLGVNDGSTPNSANYRALVRWLHGLGARVVWIEPPARVQTPSRAIIQSLGVTTVPGTSTPLSSDGLHPRTYDQWANEVAQAVTRA